MNRADPPELLFGRAVRQERLKLGMSQEDLAHECGLHRTYVGSVERGERNVSLRNLLAIAQALRLRGATLLDNSGL